MIKCFGWCNFNKIHCVAEALIMRRERKSKRKIDPKIIERIGQLVKEIVLEEY